MPGSLASFSASDGAGIGPNNVSRESGLRGRLGGSDPNAAEVSDLARAIAEQYDDPALLVPLSSAGLRGVDGALKNLIFAAHGPQPRTVLRDAISNVIELVENTDTLTVYDRRFTVGLCGASWSPETSATAGTEKHAPTPPKPDLRIRPRAVTPFAAIDVVAIDAEQSRRRHRCLRREAPMRPADRQTAAMDDAK